VVEEYIVLGGGPVETRAPKVMVLKAKGTTTVTLDFDESDDDVFDEEAKNARASRLSESIIDVNTCEKVACHLEKGVTTGNYCIYICIYTFCIYLLTLNIQLTCDLILCRGIFSRLFVS
jgi:hypothetical protein